MCLAQGLYPGFVHSAQLPIGLDDIAYGWLHLGTAAVAWIDLPIDAFFLD